MTQETLSELERNKGEVQQAIQRKEKEMAAVAAKIEDEQSLGGKMQKQTKELLVRSRRQGCRAFLKSKKASQYIATVRTSAKLTEWDKFQFCLAFVDK